MSNTSGAPVRKPAIRELDPRARRTVHALGSAMVDLMTERGFDGVTVQAILDRAGVARSTFYAHYRNKHDVLHSSYERMFTFMEERLDASPGVPPRLVPVREFLEHIESSGPFVDALTASGQLDEMWSLGTAFVARMIERHLPAQVADVRGDAVALASRMLAAAFMEMVRWWYDHRDRCTPVQMDTAFHDMAYATLGRPQTPKSAG